jgi:hypothetical protein
VIHDAADESATIGYLCADGWDDAEVKGRLHAARARIGVEVERVAAA